MSRLSRLNPSMQGRPLTPFELLMQRQEEKNIKRSMFFRPKISTSSFRAIDKRTAFTPAPRIRIPITKEERLARIEAGLIPPPRIGRPLIPKIPKIAIKQIKLLGKEPVNVVVEEEPRKLFTLRNLFIAAAVIGVGSFAVPRVRKAFK